MQSDKASVEITSPFDGIVTELLVKEGEIAKVGSGLCLIEVDEEILDEIEPTVVEPAIHPQVPPAESQPPSPTPELYVPPGGASQTRGLHPLDPKNVTDLGTLRGDNVFAAPSVRHFARQNSINLGLLVPGSGKNGRIEKRDVEAALAKEHAKESTEKRPTVEQREDVNVELGRTRYGMWKAMTRVRIHL